MACHNKNVKTPLFTRLMEKPSPINNENHKRNRCDNSLQSSIKLHIRIPIQVKTPGKPHAKAVNIPQQKPHLLTPLLVLSKSHLPLSERQPQKIIAHHPRHQDRKKKA